MMIACFPFQCIQDYFSDAQVDDGEGTEEVGDSSGDLEEGDLDLLDTLEALDREMGKLAEEMESDEGKGQQQHGRKGSASTNKGL